MRLKAITLFLVLASVSSVFAKSDRKNNEKYRPQFHFTADSNWINNPCGLFFREGVYHLFFQHNPTAKEWRNIHWGHATSNDLVHWNIEPNALSPLEDANEDRNGEQWCGAIVADRNKNFSDGSALVAFNHIVGKGICKAISKDNGMTWQQDTEQPVLVTPEKERTHDPKVFWHNESNKWIMVVYRVPGGEVSLKGFSFYSSADMMDWKFESHMPGFFETPDMFELAVDGRANQKMWVLTGANGDYILGTFDGKRFKPKSAIQKADNSKYFYAPTTWTLERDGETKHIQIAWMRSGKYPDMPFKGQLTFPCELKLRTCRDGVKLVRVPHESINTLTDKLYTWDNKKLYPGLNKNPLGKVVSDCFRLRGTFDLSSCNSFGFVFMKDLKNNGVELQYTVENNELACLGQSVKVEPINGKITLDILVDRTSIEVFANDGISNLTICYNSKAKRFRNYLVTIGGELNIDHMEVATLKSMYEPVKKKK